MISEPADHWSLVEPWLRAMARASGVVKARDEVDALLVDSCVAPA